MFFWGEKEGRREKEKKQRNRCAVNPTVLIPAVAW